MAIDGSALREWRERSGYGRKQFADRVGISHQYLCDIERGDRKLSRNPSLINRMAAELNIPSLWLQKRTGEAA